MNSKKEEQYNEVIKIISFIQSLSQSYIRTKCNDKNLADELKNKLDNLWYNNIDNYYNENKKDNEYLKSLNDLTFYVVNVNMILKHSMRIDSEELEKDLKSIYGNDAFDIFCYVIYCKLP